MKRSLTIIRISLISLFWILAVLSLLIGYIIPLYSLENIEAAEFFAGTSIFFSIVAFLIGRKTKVVVVILLIFLGMGAYKIIEAEQALASFKPWDYHIDDLKDKIDRGEDVFKFSDGKEIESMMKTKIDDMKSTVEEDPKVRIRGFTELLDLYIQDVEEEHPDKKDYFFHLKEVSRHLQGYVNMQDVEKVEVELNKAIEIRKKLEK